MELCVRSARMEDYPSVERIMMQVQNLHVLWRPDIYRPVETAISREEMAEDIENGRIFVAEDEGNVVGILQILIRHVRAPHQVKRDVLFVETMAVDEARRGRGVGHAFFDFLKVYRDKNGLDGIELQVNARNERAIEMYEKCGFTAKSINMELLT